MKVSGIEVHPFPFFLPEKAKIMLLGSFPPPENRWKMRFYYPNLQNDMWKIMGITFYGNKDHFLTTDRKSFREDEIRQFLGVFGIAMGNTALEVIRQKENASDKFLQVVKPMDLSANLLCLPHCHTLVTTGQLATDTLLQFVEAKQPKVGSCTEGTFEGRSLVIYRMPSSSRAYPMPLEQKAEIYRKMFIEAGLLR